MRRSDPTALAIDLDDLHDRKLKPTSRAAAKLAACATSLRTNAAAKNSVLPAPVENSWDIHRNECAKQPAKLFLKNLSNFLTVQKQAFSST
jgi:hypothetical protein